MVLAFISFIAGFPDSTLSSSIRAYLPSAATFVASDAVPYSIRALVAQVAPYGGYFQPAGWYFFSVLLGLHIVEAMYTTLLCWWYVDNPITAVSPILFSFSTVTDSSFDRFCTSLQRFSQAITSGETFGDG